MKNCEACNKKTKELYADCLFNMWMCVDCYSKYDWHNKIEVIENIDNLETMFVLKDLKFNIN